MYLCRYFVTLLQFNAAGFLMLAVVRKTNYSGTLITYKEKQYEKHYYEDLCVRQNFHHKILWKIAGNRKKQINRHNSN